MSTVSFNNHENGSVVPKTNGTVPPNQNGAILPSSNGASSDGASPDGPSSNGAPPEVTGSAVPEPEATPPSVPPKFHRIGEVRMQQGTSLRSVSRRMDLTVQEIREQETGTSDLCISDLLKWQEVLEVPLADLLIDSGGSSVGSCVRTG